MGLIFSITFKKYTLPLASLNIGAFFSMSGMTICQLRKWQAFNAREWQEAQKMMKTLRLITRQQEQPSAVAGCRAFVDAAWNSTTHNGGFGWSLVNASNTSQETFSAHKEGIVSALVAEAWAVLHTMNHALLLNRTELQVLSDSQTLVNLINEDGFHIELYGLLQDIRNLRRSFVSISFIYIPRLVNHVADMLAKRALTCHDLLMLNSTPI